MWICIYIYTYGSLLRIWTFDMSLENDMVLLKMGQFWLKTIDDHLLDRVNNLAIG